MNQLSDTAELFRNTFKKEPDVVASAPGRIEFIGNHTDYNGGLVLGAAIDRRIYVAIRKRKDDKVNLHSSALGASPTRTLRDLTPEKGTHGWANYPLGMLVMLKEAGLPIDQGVDLLVNSALPVGAGLSSSAALELSTGYALIGAFGGNFDRKTIARLGRRAENEFVGLPCGILDQGVSSFGKKNHLVLVDAKAETFDTVPMPPGIFFWIFNSHQKHALIGSLYATRHKECMEARDILDSFYDIKHLTDLSTAQVRVHRVDMPDELYRRALHITSENERVKQMVTLLEANELEKAGQLLFDSHQSSRVHFENSTQELDFLVDQLKQFPDVYGARLTGGGFGGAVMAMTSERFGQTQVEQIAKAYEDSFHDQPDVIQTSTADGAGIEN